jgi:hypothetical protein
VGIKNRWHSLVSCEHGDSTTSRFDSPVRPPAPSATVSVLRWPRGCHPTVRRRARKSQPAPAVSHRRRYAPPGPSRPAPPWRHPCHSTSPTPTSRPESSRHAPTRAGSWGAWAAPPIGAPCTQCLRHGDPMHARKGLTLPRAVPMRGLSGRCCPAAAAAAACGASVGKPGGALAPSPPPPPPPSDAPAESGGCGAAGCATRRRRSAALSSIPSSFCRAGEHSAITRWRQLPLASPPPLSPPPNLLCSTESSSRFGTCPGVSTNPQYFVTRTGAT